MDNVINIFHKRSEESDPSPRCDKCGMSNICIKTMDLCFNEFEVVPVRIHICSQCVIRELNDMLDALESVASGTTDEEQDTEE